MKNLFLFLILFTFGFSVKGLPTIIRQPSNQTTTLGGRTVFNVLADGNAVTYQWLKNGTSIPGATNSALVITNVQFTNAGPYSARLTESSSSVTSSSANLIVNSPRAGLLDASFDPGSKINGPIFCSAVQTNGAILIGGSFTTVNGATRNRIARLYSDGSTDFTFMDGLAGANATVMAIALQNDGKILIGGDFTNVNGISRGYLARLNRDGSLDTNSFTAFNGLNSSVYCLSVQPDGKIIAGGQFGNALIRLNTNGSIDTSFSGFSSVNSTVRSVALQADGKIVIGGSFLFVNGVSRNRIARLNTNGSLDTNFLNGLTGPNSDVRSIAIQSDEKIVIGGLFTIVNGSNSYRFARLSNTGTLDTAFSNGGGAGNNVHSVILQPDGKVVIAGEFTNINNIARSSVARLNTNGAVDLTFLDGLVGASWYAYSTAVMSNGDVLVCGDFGFFNQSDQNAIARLNKNTGASDLNFAATGGLNNSVSTMALQSDGKILIGGAFTGTNFFGRNRIARLNRNGSVDTGFLNGLSGPNDSVLAVATQTNGKVMIGGTFTSVNGTARMTLARLETNGSLDSTFLNGLAGPDNTIRAVAIQSDGKIIIGGFFKKVNGVNQTGIARLLTNGVLDPSFLNPLSGVGSGSVYSVAIQQDGKILVGGLFNGATSIGRSGMVRLNSDGSLDTGFMNGLSGTTGTIYSLLQLPNGKIAAGGTFTSFNGISRNRVIRLNNDGTVDTSFMNGLTGSNSDVRSIAIQSEEKLLICGSFTTVNGTTINRIARLNKDGSLDTDFISGFNGLNGTGQCAISQPDETIIVGGSFTTINSESKVAIGRLWGTSLKVLADDGALGIVSGKLGFNIAGFPGQTVYVDSSPNLQTWTPISTNVLATNRFYFRDSRGNNRDFYRLRSW